MFQRTRRAALLARVAVLACFTGAALAPSAHAQTQCVPWLATLINGYAAIAWGSGYIHKPKQPKPA